MWTTGCDWQPWREREPSCNRPCKERKVPCDSSWIGSCWNLLPCVVLISWNSHCSHYQPYIQYICSMIYVDYRLLHFHGRTMFLTVFLAFGSWFVGDPWLVALIKKQAPSKTLKNPDMHRHATKWLNPLILCDVMLLKEHMLEFNSWSSHVCNAF